MSKLPVRFSSPFPAVHPSVHSRVTVLPGATSVAPFKKIFISAYSPKLKVELVCDPEKSRTKQSFKDECNINVIMSRYLKTGVMDFVSKHEPQYGDVTGLDFQSAMDIVARGQTMFHDLPSAIRNRFENDAALFLDFISDDRNRKEMAEMGLLNQAAADAILKPPPPPVEAPAAPAAVEPPVVPASVAKPS